MARITARITEEDNFDAALDATFTKIYARALPRAVRRAQALAPVDTGRLRRNLHAQGVFTRHDAVFETGGVPYTIFQEGGTRFIKPRRFIEDGLRSVFQSHQQFELLPHELSLSSNRFVNQPNPIFGNPRPVR